MPRITMKDVAQVMGVSTMTVSNAFNRPDQLSQELRDRILTRAEKMGYGAPNAAARNLRQGRSDCYGVVFSESLNYAFRDPFSVIWLGGLSEALEQAGKSMTLLPVSDSDQHNLDLIRRASVDGIAGLCASNPALRAAQATGVPVVITDPVDPDGSWVAIDDREAGRQIGEHVRRLGHRDVVLVVEDCVRFRGAPMAEQPLDSFLRTLDEYLTMGLFDTWSRVDGFVAGLGEGVEIRVVVAPLNSRTEGRRAAEVVLDQEHRPTAIICVSDVVAMGVMDAMEDRALVPGRDITLTGFDDLPDTKRAGLTTVRQPIAEKGRLVGELLLDPARTHRPIMLPHRLIVRASSAPPRTR